MQKSLVDSDFKNSNQFLGHAGVGARIECVRLFGRLVIQQTDLILQFSKIKSLDVFKSYLRSDAVVRDNYTILLMDHGGKEYKLCTSDNEKNINSVCQKMKTELGI